MRDDCVVERGDTAITAQGFGLVGRIFESEEAYEEHILKRKLRNAVRCFFTKDYGQNWDKVPDDTVRQIAEILGVTTK